MLLETQCRQAIHAGHGSETRAALARLDARLKRGVVTVLGPLAPDAALCEFFRKSGALEGSARDSRAPTRTVVIPLTGLPKADLRRWKESGHELLDLTLPAIRRAQSSLGLLATENAKPLIAGFHDDSECATITGDVRGVAVVEDADEATLLPFAPKFGMVCQTLVSRRRAGLVAEALRQRHPDCRMVFLDTTSPAALERERSVEALSRWSEAILVAGEAGEASVRALVDASRRLGVPAFPVADAGKFDPNLLAGATRIGLTAGEFSPDFVVEAIAARLESAR